MLMILRENKVYQESGLARPTEDLGAHGQTGLAGATGLPDAREPKGRGAADAPGLGGSAGATGDHDHPRPDGFEGQLETVVPRVYKQDQLVTQEYKEHRERTHQWKSTR